METHVERDDSEERKGKYRMRVCVEFHGPLSEWQRTALTRAVAACPIPKRMTSAEIAIETMA